MIADEVNMNQETVCLILTEECGIRKICAKMVPRNLAEQQYTSKSKTSSLQLITLSSLKMRHCCEICGSLSGDTENASLLRC
jgi:hypothetical protein